VKKISQVCLTGAFLAQVKGEANTPGIGKSNGNSPASEGSGSSAFASLLQNILGGSETAAINPAPAMGGSEGSQADFQPAAEETEWMDREEEALGDIPQDVYRLLFPEGNLPMMFSSEAPEGDGEALVPIQEGPDHRQTIKEALTFVSPGINRVERETVETRPVLEFRFEEAEPAADTVDALQNANREQDLRTEGRREKPLGLEAREGFIRQDQGIREDFSLGETEEQVMDRFKPESISRGDDKHPVDGLFEGNDGKIVQDKGNHPLPFFLRDVREEIQSIRTKGEGKADVLFSPVTQTPVNGTNGAVWEPIQEESLVSSGKALSESIMEQVTAGVKVFNRDKGSQLELQLKPEGLGRLTIKLSLQDGEMMARIITDNLQVREILHQEAHTLQSILRNEHIDFTQLEVVYQQAEPGMEMSHHGGAPYREGHGDSPAPQNRGRMREENPGDGVIPESASTAGMLNYFV